MSGKKLYKDELYDVYASSNITRVIKSRRMRWAVHVALMGREDMNIGFW